jgi:hypothetical protein
MDSLIRSSLVKLFSKKVFGRASQKNGEVRAEAPKLVIHVQDVGCGSTTRRAKGDVVVHE